MSELKCAACQRTLSSLEPLTFEEAQSKQPWTVPYSSGVLAAITREHVPHLLASHTVLHAAKTVGKLATAAIRFANLYGFSLADALEERVKEKNGVGIR